MNGMGIESTMPVPAALCDASHDCPVELVWHAASGAVAMRLNDGRWHFQHGPIDLIIAADVAPDAPASVLDSALKVAWQTFTGILGQLSVQLPVLRQPVCKSSPVQVPPFSPLSDLPSPHAPIWRCVQGGVARAMLAACWPYAPHMFITPMAAVAGAVADVIVQAFARQPGIRRAYVNNGGDIALHISGDARYRVGLYADLSRTTFPMAAEDLDGTFAIHADANIRGIATSGWRGRSFSLGIADSVTVLAASGAQADAAATVIANQVNADHPAIERTPARLLKDDSDLADAAVTTQVGKLPDAIIEQALERGQRQANALLSAGLIAGAVLVLQGQRKVVFAENLVPVNTLEGSTLTRPSEMLSFA